MLKAANIMLFVVFDPIPSNLPPVIRADPTASGKKRSWCWTFVAREAK